MFRHFRKFYAPEGAAAGSGGAADGSQPATSSAQPAAAGTTDAGAAAASASASAAAANRYSYSEDRSNWLPPHRLDEVRRGEQTRYQQLEQRYQDLDGRMRRFFDVPTPRDPRHEQLRSSIAEIIPELAPFMKGENAQQLTKLLELAQSGRLDDALGTTNSYWTRHANTYAREAALAYAKEIGKDLKDLPKNTVPRMALNLQAFIQEDRTGQRYQRYEMNDPSLIEEWLDQDIRPLYSTPLRSSLATQGARQVERNRRLPQGGQRGSMPAGGGEKKAPLRGKELISAARRYAAGDEADA